MKRFPTTLLALVLLTPALLVPGHLNAADKVEAEDDARLASGTFAGLALRPLGPAITSGRISDIAVHPTDRKTYYVAVASGGLWKTVNAGTTWKPIFDSQSSYSMGCVTIDPNNPLTIWAGSGENNSQRSVGYGDGVYKSIDGGATWKNMGLENSEHIAKIVVDPRDSQTVYVASQGPLWSAGGDRGLYKSIDGGETWEPVLQISEHTGVTDFVMDPRNPDVLVAAAYQRRRHVWTLINGGPESAIYKSTDGGANWVEIESGLPGEDMGRIGLAQSPVDPDVLYALIEAAGDDAGFYRSTDGGATWSKRSDYDSASPQYYQELVPDPTDVDRVYSMDTWMHVTEDGGASFKKVGETFKHVDNHALWIDPEDPDYLLAGCDGGVYESFDRGATWVFKANLPVTQFYKVGIDNDFPFYNVYGGTQDNFTLGGPSRTTTAHGITNREWFVTVGGDGFQTRVDPEDPDIIYSQSQYGELVRHDRSNGETLSIKPQPADGEVLKFNWDAPLIISPHSHTRLYFAANRLFRSDDRGDNWTPVSPDLTRGIDRNQLEVMGKVWGVDSVSKNRSTSAYGNIVALAESPLVEGLLYAGTDDGLVQVSEDGGATWRAVDQLPGVPERTYLGYLTASQHDPDTVYAAPNNHKNGDFSPYLVKSTDRGRSWTSVAADLPERGSVYSIAEDHVDGSLLFVGTEFGLFFSPTGGDRWIQLQGGMPPVAVRDIALQQRENDLVAATFGRGFYVLDDYSALRGIDESALGQEAILFGVKDAWMFMPSYPLGLRGKAFQGDGYFTAENPPFGAVVSYYLKESLQSKKEMRQKTEADMVEKGEPVGYPGWSDLQAEDREQEPTVVVTVRDSSGAVVRRLQGPVSAGIHRIAWDLRYPPMTPTSLKPFSMDNPFSDPPSGPMVAPGTYSVKLSKRVDGRVAPLAGPESFETVPLGVAALPAADREELLAFQRQIGSLQRAALGAAKVVDETRVRLDYLHKALMDTPGAEDELSERLEVLRDRLDDLDVELRGNRTVASRNEPVTPSIIGRVQRVVYAQWNSTSAPTGTNREAYRLAGTAFTGVLESLRSLVEVDLASLEEEMERIGAPWTPGRIPSWDLAGS